ncbi:MAG: helix-turn-helix domain-containing protein [Planctomycetes bacterium]|nr:helix-turn-helix domain-containing protein [Planctomycetota bacterium]
MAGTKSDQIRELLSTGMSDADIAKKVGCSRNLVYIVKSKAGKTGGKRRGPGRPKGSTSKASRNVNVSAGSLDDLLSGVRSIQAERDQLRKALENIRDVLNRVLG